MSPLREIPVDDGGGERSRQISVPAVLGVLSIVFHGATLAAYAGYQLLRRLRLRASVCFVILLASAALLSWVFYVTDAAGMFASFFSRVFEDGLGSTWPLFLYPFELGSVIIGLLFVAPPLIFWAAWDMRYNKEATKILDTWQFNFQYRRTPWQWLKYKRKVKDLIDGACGSDERAPVGLCIDYERRDDVVYRYYSEANSHTLVFGSPGSGKTISVMSMIANDIFNTDYPVIMVDFKASPKLTANIASWAQETGRPFYHFMGGAPEDYFLSDNGNGGQAYYEPLNGSPGTKADMMLGMRDYETGSEVYKSNMQQVLQVIFAALEAADRSKAPSIVWDEGALRQVQTVLLADNLTELAAACEDTPVEANITDIVRENHGKTQIAHAIKELSGQVRTLMASEYGRWLRVPKDEDARFIDLRRLTAPSDNPPVVLFSFNADSQQEFSSLIGSLTFADITNVSSERRNEGMKNPVLIYADEFQAVPVEAVKGLLEKSRESKMCMTLSCQALNQIAQGSRNQDSQIRSVLDTCDNFFIHAGSTQDTAEIFSGIVGPTSEVTYTSTTHSKRWFFEPNFANRRNQVTTKNEDREAPKVRPEAFMSLEKPMTQGRSTAVVINRSTADPRYSKIPGALARKTWMLPEARVLADEAASERKAFEALKRKVEPSTSLNTSTLEVIDPEPATAAQPSVQSEDEEESTEGTQTPHTGTQGRTAEAEPKPRARLDMAKYRARREAQRVSSEEDDGGFGFEPIEPEQEESQPAPKPATRPRNGQGFFADWDSYSPQRRDS